MNKQEENYEELDQYDYSDDEYLEKVADKLVRHAELHRHHEYVVSGIVRASVRNSANCASIDRTCLSSTSVLLRA